MDPDDADIPRLNELGYDVFTSVDALRGNADRLVAVDGGDQPAGTGMAGLADDAPIPDRVEDGAFDAALFTRMDRSRSEAEYDPLGLKAMCHQYGALGAARKLLATRTVSDGFVALWERERLDLTVEALVLNTQFTSLFTDDERTTARRRLEAVGVDLAGVAG